MSLNILYMNRNYLTEWFVLDEGEDGNIPDGAPEESHEGVQHPAVLLHLDITVRK